jgi:hypothetical protein
MFLRQPRSPGEFAGHLTIWEKPSGLTVSTPTGRSVRHTCSVRLTGPLNALHAHHPPFAVSSSLLLALGGHRALYARTWRDALAGACYLLSFRAARGQGFGLEVGPHNTSFRLLGTLAGVPSFSPRRGRSGDPATHSTAWGQDFGPRLGPPIPSSTYLLGLASSVCLCLFRGAAALAA